MKVIKATDIERFSNWTALIYAEPGIGKTSMIKSLVGRTILFSTDGMYHVLHGEKDVDIIVMDSSDPVGELRSFYRFLQKNINDYDNIVIDNISTYQKFWLGKAGEASSSGMPRIQDYGVLDRILMSFVGSLKKFKKNVLILAHEKKVEITATSGGVYTQFQPDLRNLDAIMGIIPVVGRLVMIKDKEDQDARVIVLQPTRATRAKDQLIGDMQTIPQMDLLPLLTSESQ